MRDTERSRSSEPTAEEAELELLAPGLVHELRQPLMGIRAGLTLVARRLGPTLQSLEEWEMLVNQLARLEEILRGYDELVRPDAIAPGEIAVEPIVARAVDLLAHRVRPLERRFAFARGDGPHRGYGTAGALLHAATNLIANALDAVEEAGRSGRVAVRIVGDRASGAGVQVRVSDEGPGVPADLRERIFEPRFTTKPPGKGTGLGLHIARRVMTRCGGDVYLVDERDVLRLPWASAEFCIQLAAPPEARP